MNPGYTPATAETGPLAAFVASTSFDDLPPATVDQARLLILDAIGAGLVGSRAAIAPAVVATSLRMGGPATEARILGFSQRTSAYLATMANAGFVHQVELGDAVERAVVHSSTAVVPAALAVAEREKACGQALLRAVSLGCETLIRFGRALATDPSQPSESSGDNPVTWLHGWLPPALLSPFGASTAAAVVCGATDTQLLDTWGIAANLCPATVRGIMREDVTAKGVFMGTGCANGVLAADLAAAGVTGLKDLVGKWMPVIVPAFDRTRLTLELGQTWEMQAVRYKYIATAAPLHPPIEAVFALLESGATFDLNDVAAVHIECFERTFFNFTRDVPRTAAAAKANLAYCVAVAMVTRDRRTLVREAFEDTLLFDPRVLDLAARIDAAPNARYTALHPHVAELASIRIELRSGDVLEREVDLRQMPKYYQPTPHDIEEKFVMVTQGILPEAASRNVCAVVASLEDIADVRELLDCIEVDR